MKISEIIREAEIVNRKSLAKRKGVTGCGLRVMGRFNEISEIFKISEIIHEAEIGNQCNPKSVESLAKRRSCGFWLRVAGSSPKSVKSKKICEIIREAEIGNRKSLAKHKGVMGCGLRVAGGFNEICEILKSVKSNAKRK